MRDALRGLGFTKGLILITHRLSFLNNTLFSTTTRLKKVSLGERVVIYNIYILYITVTHRTIPSGSMAICHAFIVFWRDKRYPIELRGVIGTSPDCTPLS
jgi:hypothetical protein